MTRHAVVAVYLVCALGMPSECAPPDSAKNKSESAATVRYMLPKTALTVDLVVERSNDLPGKYCDLRDLFFPELDLIASCQLGENPDPGTNLIEKKQRTAVQSFAVTLKGVPDAGRTHEITVDGSWNVDRTASMNFTDGGVMTGADVQRTDRTAEIVLGFASNIARIAGRFVFGSGTDLKVMEKKSAAPWDNIPEVQQNFSLLSDARKRAYEGLWRNEGGHARLVLAGRSYLAVKETSSKLAGVLSGDGAQGVATLLPELQKQLTSQLADFLGTRTKDSWTPSYEFTPDAPLAGKSQVEFPLFRLVGCGVFDEQATPGKNPLAALACNKLNGGQIFDVKLTVETASGRHATRLDTPDMGDDPKKNALYHIRPEPVFVNVKGTCSAGVTLQSPTGFTGHTNRDCRFVRQPSFLAQWGVQSSLPSAGRDWSYSVVLYEATGALKSIKLASKAILEKGTIDTAFGVANTLLDAQAAAEKSAQAAAAAAAAKGDELNSLVRSRQILEERAKIRKLCQDLGLATCEY